MKEIKTTFNVGKRVREDVPRGLTQEKKINCSWYDVNLVLNDWKKIMANFKKISIAVSQKFFSDNPLCKNMFPSFSDLQDADMIHNGAFLIHSYAVMKGINTIMRNLSGEYEEENEILPAIGETHFKRNISLSMMNDLRDAVLYACCRFLESSRQEKDSWEAVLDFVFRDYLCRCYTIEEEVSNQEESIDSSP